METEVEPTSAVEKSRYFNRMDEAFGILCLSISPELLFHVESCSTPNEVWKLLEELFGKQNEMLKMVEDSIAIYRNCRESFTLEPEDPHVASMYATNYVQGLQETDRGDPNPLEVLEDHSSEGVKVDIAGLVQRQFLDLVHVAGPVLELPLPPTEGLTPGAECTTDIPAEMAFPLKKAMDGMEKPFRSLLGQLSPDYLVHDFVQSWAQSATAEMRIPVIYLSVLAPVSCCYFLHPSKLRNQEITTEELAAPPFGFPSSTVSFRLYEAQDILVMYSGIPGHVPSIYRFSKSLEGCVAVDVKFCFEYEDGYIRYSQNAIGVPILSVGPLMPTVQPVAGSGEGSNLLKWLDTQRPGSVVFVSFGSETFLSREEACVIAFGLEMSGVPFLWSLRVPQYLDEPTELLPDGFKTRTRDHGLVVRCWVQQMLILSHGSTGGYLSHDGWSSAMEALTCGLPLILLPLRLDHGLNARQITMELKAGIEIERGDDGSFSKESICRDGKELGALEALQQIGVDILNLMVSKYLLALCQAADLRHLEENTLSRSFTSCVIDSG